jgi:hypothetical protein
MPQSSSDIYETCPYCHKTKLFHEFSGLATCNTCRATKRTLYNRNKTKRAPLGELNPNSHIPTESTSPPKRRRSCPPFQPSINNQPESPKRRRGRPAKERPATNQPSHTLQSQQDPHTRRVLPGNVSPSFQELITAEQPKGFEHERPLDRAENRPRPEESEDESTPPQSHTFTINYQGAVVHNIEQLLQQT